LCHGTTTNQNNSSTDKNTMEGKEEKKIKHELILKPPVRSGL